MSRFCGNKNTAPILQAAQQWQEVSLLNGQSLFGFGDIWNSHTLDELVTYFVDNLNYGEGNFVQKLETQLASARPESKILCAEIMWAMLLAPSNIKPSKKRENINHILAWAGVELPENQALLGDEPLSGIGSGGTAYNNLRWKELVYAIRLFKALFSLSPDERGKLLQNGQDFAQWLETIPDNGKRQFRHMLLYLLFPDGFERIFGQGDRKKVLKSFSGLDKQEINALKASEMDEALATIRAEQVESFNTEQLDWYVPPLKAMWQDTSKSKEGTEGHSIYDTLMTFLEQAHTESLRTQDYPRSHAGLTMRISFGAGNQAHVPWIGLLSAGQTPTKGIYPVYLYYRADSLLVLAKGVSATNPPLITWETDEESQTVEQYFQTTLHKSAIRYGESYIHQVYDLSEALDKDQIDADLDELIDEYLSIVGGLPIDVKEPEPSYQSDTQTASAAPMSVDSLMSDVFIGKQDIKDILALLHNKKNIVLQGPPGVGKSFVAKKLAYALMGEKAPQRVEMVQFHQSYAYEDFVQGYRPSDSGFELKNGLFHQFCSKAAKDPNNTYVFVIDEINRGNLSKIFGELMLLIEADKRGEEWQAPLTYSKDLGERFHVPENVHLIGLMNTADRSLAMVDYALRRRFAFVDLKPEFKSEGFTRFMQERGAEQAMIATITSRMNSLNDRIAKDSANLGPGFCIGHSFFCAASDSGLYDNAWYRQIVNFEIAPLIREYWFDDPGTAQSLIDELLA
ncbi:MrcB family domain-containing protein [Spongiibacter tropicus]|uniref:MrcB family domain-containing protein n=1 Tax=Spongiibacter tropicus TaxID=454602 RepID=UPI0003B34869|nr:DUF3578 domain-containing protein [Spongiibacter tropicus]